MKVTLHLSSRNNIKINIGKINRKISGLELQRKQIYDNILQLKQALNKLILKLRAAAPSSDNPSGEITGIISTSTSKDRPIKVTEQQHDRQTGRFQDNTIHCQESSNNVSMCSDIGEVATSWIEDDFKENLKLQVNKLTEVKSAGNQSGDILANFDLRPALCDISNITPHVKRRLPKVETKVPVKPDNTCVPYRVGHNNDPIVISDDEDDELMSLVEKSEVVYREFKGSEDKTISASVVSPPVISNLEHSFAQFSFKKSAEKPSVFKAPKIPIQQSSFQVPARLQQQASKFKPPLPPGVQKSKQAKHFEAQHIQGQHRSNKPVNSVASFNKAKYRLLRPSGRRGAVVRGRLIDQVKFVTKDPIPYTETGYKNRGVVGNGMFVVTGQHDQAKQAVQPVHLDGQAKLTKDGKVVFNGELYSQYSQTQGYKN